MNALILAAGLGTRLGVLTAERPKALVEVAGKTMLEHQILNLKRHGFDTVAVNVHHFSNLVMEFLQSHDFGVNIMVEDETETLLDTGGGIRASLPLFPDGEPVLVHNVDIFSHTDLGALYRSHCQSGIHATLLTAERETSRYLYFNREGYLRGWSNLKSGEVRSPFPEFNPENHLPLAFQGIHVVSQSMLPALKAIQQPSFGITDFYVDHAAKLEIRSVKMPQQTPWVDAGKPSALPLAAQIASTVSDQL